MAGSEAQSPHRLVEFLTAISRCQDSASALSAAVELVAEEFDAEVGAVVLGQIVSAAVGFGQGRVPEETLRAILPGIGTVSLEGLGPCHTLAAVLSVGRSGRLVVARTDFEFATEDRNLLLGMARALDLALEMIGVLERERGNLRVLEVLLGIQRSISHRAPLSTILAAITDGASAVLGGCPVSLLLDDALDPDRPIITGADLTHSPGTVSSPVHIHGVPAGALVASTRDGAPVRDEERELLHAFAEHASLALTDASTVEAMQEAFRDPLTGLPNRTLFLERLTQALREGGPYMSRPSVLFIDLDRFKAVNDSLGHAGGDELLRAAADRIRRCTRAEDTAARFGGDEFALVLQEDDTRSRGPVVAERIIAALREPFAIRGKIVFVGVTIGIAHADADADADELLGNADLAMYRAKREGGSRARLYDPAMRTALLERLELEADLQDALPRRELELHYQPIVEIDNGATTGFEALLRWRHPAKGLLFPTAFIPIAEATGLIVDIGRWVLNEACARLAEWRHDVATLTMHVNVSVHQLRDPSFVSDVETALLSAGLPGAALTVEITESALIEDHEAIFARLRDLRELGVLIALDDFGTGYSCLGYLQQFPVDVLKIDRSFVSGAGAGTDQLIRMILELGRAFGLDTIAEGIETADQRARLRRLGCQSGQGFYFARPMDAAAATAQVAGLPVRNPRLPVAHI